MDRTVATGTGYVGQYPPPVAKLYESLESTPDELLLFFHHVPYTRVLKSGKTVIQHIYDSHYEGAERAAQYVHQWKSLSGRIDEQRYSDVLTRLEYQAGHAIVWRDAVSNWFFGMSGIPDEQHRVGIYPDRFKATRPWMSSREKMLPAAKRSNARSHSDVRLPCGLKATPGGTT